MNEIFLAKKVSNSIAIFFSPFIPSIEILRLWFIGDELSVLPNPDAESKDESTDLSDPRNESYIQELTADFESIGSL